MKQLQRCPTCRHEFLVAGLFHTPRKQPELTCPDCGAKFQAEGGGTLHRYADDPKEAQHVAHD
jgi:transcription elongation factor Elf1